MCHFALKKQNKNFKMGIDNLWLCDIMLLSAWLDGRKLDVVSNLRKVRASKSRVLANYQSRQLEGKCNRK